MNSESNHSDKLVSLVGPNCERCPLFDRCRAMLAARVVADMVVIVDDENHPYKPWTKKESEKLGIISDGTKLEEGSVADMAKKIIEDCDGPIKKEIPESSVPLSSFDYVFPGDDIRRRPIGGSKDAGFTVKIKVDKAAQIKELDKCKNAESLTEFGDYRRFYPPRTTEVAPFGCYDNGTMSSTPSSSLDQSPIEEIIKTEGRPTDALSLRARAKELLDIAARMEEREKEKNKNTWR